MCGTVQIVVVVSVAGVVILNNNIIISNSFYSIAGKDIGSTWILKPTPFLIAYVILGK